VSGPQPPLVAPLRRWDPEQVGGYILLGRLGAGAMGQVYLGRSAAGRLVAVKTIKSELAEEPDFRTRFGQEVAAARRVSGAFTAAVIAADSEADVPWLATVYVPAPSLTRLVRHGGPLPVPAVCWLAAGCAEALEAIHGVGLVHRDLKPSNVLVSPDGPRVIDFGVARAAERIQLTVTRGSPGTPAYMAPEQARDTRQATAASDVFSLGATILFAATGHAAYDGDTVMDVLVRLATEPPDLAGLPPELTSIVSACLDRDPRNRPSTASIVARLTEMANLESPSLPASAFALIEEFRAAPALGAPAPGYGGVPGQLAGTGAGAVPGSGSGSGDDGTVPPGDSTLGSQPGGGPPRRATAHAAGRAGAGSPPGRRRAMFAVSWAVAAVALIGAGWAIGSQRVGGGHPAPAASRSSSRVGDNSTVPASGGSLGPVIQPPGAPPPFPGQSPASGKPYVAVSQPTGDPDTTFVIRGQNWPARTRLTIALTGGRVVARVITDFRGTFNYAINQGHEFFHAGLPTGFYEVTVTGPDGHRARARFEVVIPPGG
jgi:Protein kinase domain